jgi:FkbM family methyltransferase
MPAMTQPGGLTREHVVWAYRLLLDREPESEDVIGPKLAGSQTTAELRHHLITSAEFRAKNPDFAHTNDSTVVIKEIAPGVRLFIDLSDHVIGLNILRGHYEQDEIRFVRRLLKPGDSAIDVGAHIGFFAMHMAAAVGPDGRVYAFEPFDANADLLERSIGENGFVERVRFQRAAVGAAPGTAMLTFPAETLNSGGAYLLRDGTAPLAGNQKKDVPVVALDALAFRRPVRFVKMDVEGAEPQAVRGAERLLREDRPVILSELHPTQLDRASGVTAAQFLAQMQALGYRAHTLRGDDGSPNHRRQGFGGPPERSAKAESGNYEELLGAPLEAPPADALVSIAFVPSASN